MDNITAYFIIDYLRKKHEKENLLFYKNVKSFLDEE
jgi:hypothetical protein